MAPKLLQSSADMGSSTSDRCGFKMQQYFPSNKYPIRYFIGDVRDLEFLKSAISESQPSLVIHLAAQPIVHRSYNDPLETFQTNIIGTANLLEAARNNDSVKEKPAKRKECEGFSVIIPENFFRNEFRRILIYF